MGGEPSEVGQVFGRMEDKHRRYDIKFDSFALSKRRGHIWKLWGFFGGRGQRTTDG